MIINSYSNKVRKILSNNITRFRLNNKWSQEDFADKLGAKSTYISGIENCKRNIRLDYISRIAETLGVPIHELFIESETVANHRITRRKNK